MDTKRIEELMANRAAIDKELAELRAQAKAELKAAFAVPKTTKRKKKEG
jgi:hypothetical protein